MMIIDFEEESLAVKTCKEAMMITYGITNKFEVNARWFN